MKNRGGGGAELGEDCDMELLLWMRNADKVRLACQRT
jgi:hypothetical protein